MRVVLKYLGYLILISSVFRILPIITAVVYGETPLMFVIGTAISIILGAGLVSIPVKENQEISLTMKQGLLLTTLSFLVLPVLGSTSFIGLSGMGVTDALFESYSGYTTTGLTVINSLDVIPKHLLLWRAETQWIGGIGIVIVFLFIFAGFTRKEEDYDVGAKKTDSSHLLYQAQGFTEKVEANTKRSIMRIVMIYLVYTGIGILLLLATGMSLFESIAISFTSISTGGFSVTDSFYTAPSQLAVISLLMILGATSFLYHNRLFRLKFKELFDFIELRQAAILFTIFAGITLFFYKDVVSVVFNLISAMTTTGFAAENISMLPSVFIMFIMLSMLIGGSMGSTAGGLKQFRFYLLLKTIPWLVKKISYPLTAIIPLKVEKRPLPQENLLVVEAFASLYFICLAIGTALFVILGYGFLDSAFQVFSALGTVGLQTIQISSVPIVGKYVLILLMVLGRLEIFPVFVLLRTIITRK